MDRKLAPKVIFIIVLVVVAAWTLFPPTETLKPGIDLAGGTSLIYEIDTQELEAIEVRGLSERMIDVLRRRIDPANIQNLIWRPQGSNRFEIQMPLASAEARQKRQEYERIKDELLADNISRAKIMRSLQKPVEERVEDFNDFAKDSNDRLAILDRLATVYDERKELRTKGDGLYADLESAEEKISAAALDLDQIRLNRGEWAKLGEEQRQESLKEFLGSEDNLDLLGRYIQMYAEWEEVEEKLTNPETGKNIEYDEAKKELDKLNLTEEQIKVVLEMSAKSARRRREIERLKSEFADRAEKIDKLVSAYDEYRPYRGRLDDPKDLVRMLKGAGVLEFRILPTQGHPDIDMDEMNGYVENFSERGPKYASDDKYVWCELESVVEWVALDEQGRPFIRVRDGQERPAIVAAFGEKYYVLASNKKNEKLLHGGEGKDWRLKKANPTTDEMGKRAIGFLLDERGGKLFFNVTKDNPDRPLCILLDGLAISAPKIDPKGGPIGSAGRISGNFTQTEVEDMVNKLNAGSLPARLIEPPISVKTIGPSIGADNRDQGIRAGLIGLVAVVLCMAIYYMLAGSIADVALLMNLVFVLAIMAYARATFTLPGIAGIILTIGMSVDANVLIFERIREEQEKGSSLRIAIRNGYQRAFRTILDANLTTFITAAILFWVASEEIKGFAIVLMLGIGSSMFTALFVTRVVFDVLLARRVIKDRLFMLRIIGQPNVNWMSLRPIFLSVSTVLIAGGLFVFFTRGNKYDIEFTGGTSVQIDLKEGVNLSRQEVEDIISKVGVDLENPALAAARVYSIGKSGRQYEINTIETNRTTANVTFVEPGVHSVETLITAIRGAQAKLGGRLSNLRVIALSNPSVFEITTSQLNKSLVKNVLSSAFPGAEISEPQVDEVVNDAILTAFSGKLEIRQSLRPEISSEVKITEELIDQYPELVDFLGGVKVTCRVERATTAEEIAQRFADLRYKPDMRDLNWSYSTKILDSELNEMEPDRLVESFVYLSVHEEAGLRELTEDEWSQFVKNERRKVVSAAELEASLSRVTQIDPSVGAEAKTRALIAIILSLAAIITYIWIRFGNVRYGVAAIAALVHDVSITLGAVTACTYIATRAIGETLLIGDFKINLAIIAAFLTLIGYSLNDTIVVFDRIRENRRKARENAKIVTDSINQTISRTLLTSFTTFIVVLIMYMFGGQGLRGFTFAIGFGILIGTYSSIAIAAPLLLLGGKTKQERDK